MKQKRCWRNINLFALPSASMWPATMRPLRHPAGGPYLRKNKIRHCERRAVVWCRRKAPPLGGTTDFKQKPEMYKTRRQKWRRILDCFLWRFYWRGAFCRNTGRPQTFYRKGVWYQYNGRHPHWTEDFEGDRWSIVAYKNRSQKDLKNKTLQ